VEKIVHDIEAALFEQKHDVTIHPAHVYIIDERLKGTITRDEFKRANNKYVFLANPRNIFSNDIFDCIFELQLKNCVPILSFPEKTAHLVTKYPRLTRLKERGCQFQIDLLSLTGYCGAEAKKASTYLLENQLVRFVSFGIKDLDLIKKYNGIRITKRIAKLLDQQLFVG